MPIRVENYSSFGYWLRGRHKVLDLKQAVYVVSETVGRIASRRIEDFFKIELLDR